MTHDLPKPSTGLLRRWRHVSWSARRRILPSRQVLLPFDHGLRIKVTPRDRVARSIYLNGYSDREHAAFLHRFLKPGMCYFDIGAHCGQFTLVAAGCVGPSGSVHSFEPTERTYQQLRENLSLNGLTWVRASHAAVFDSDGEIELTTCVPNKAEFNAIGRPLRPDDEIVGKETVPTVTVDHYCGEHGVQRIDLMKIDTNGAELHVIRGGYRTLSSADAPVVICEFNDVTIAGAGYTTRALRHAFFELGYALYRLNSEQGRLVPEPEDRTYPTTVDLIACKDAERFEILMGDSTG